MPWMKEATGGDKAFRILCPLRSCKYNTTCAKVPQCCMYPDLADSGECLDNTTPVPRYVYADSWEYYNELSCEKCGAPLTQKDYDSYEKFCHDCIEEMNLGEFEQLSLFD